MSLIQEALCLLTPRLPFRPQLCDAGGSASEGSPAVSAARCRARPTGGGRGRRRAGGCGAAGLRGCSFGFPAQALKAVCLFLDPDPNRVSFVGPR